MPIDNVEEIVMNEEDAQKAYEDYAEAVKGRKEEYLEELKKVYYALSQGKKVINIFEAMRIAGKNEKGEPKLAISVASEKIVRFTKQAQGSGTYSNTKLSAKYNVLLPSETWETWQLQDPTKPFNWTSNPRINEQIEAIVPIVPAHLLPRGQLSGYYVLWEPKEWKALPQRKDPFLLKRISNNLFVVLAEWEVSAIEQAAVQGAQLKER